MKRNYIPFGAGMVTMMMLVGLMGASMAMQDPTTQNDTADAAQTGRLNGQVAYGEAGIAVLDKECVPAGTTITTKAGAQVPTVLTYTDENGEEHYFINAETAVDVFDVAYGVIYDEETGNVNFGAEYLCDEDGNIIRDDEGKPALKFTAEEDYGSYVVATSADGTTITTANVPTEVSAGDGQIVTVGGNMKEDPSEMSPESLAFYQERVANNMKISTTAEYGTVRGMFTEVDPAEVDKATLSANFMDRDTFGADEEVNYTFAFTPQFGKYAQITIENTGKADAIVLVSRPHTLGNADAEEYFSKVRVPAGQTLTRTFLMDENGMEPGNKLAVAITSVDEGAVQVRLSANEFYGSTQK